MDSRRLMAIVAAMGLAATVGASTTPTSQIFINEIHYDNTGTDAGEAIEVVAPTGTLNIGLYTIVLYNGNGGAVYDTDALSTATATADPLSGRTYYVLNYAVNGLQNGPPDGVALVDDAGTVIEFLSYEGTFTAVGGAADGLLSTDIGVLEDGTGPAGQSLQRTGVGGTAGDQTWTGPIDATFGAENTGQTVPVELTSFDVD